MNYTNGDNAAYYRSRSVKNKKKGECIFMPPHTWPKDKGKIKLWDAAPQICHQNGGFRLSDNPTDTLFEAASFYREDNHYVLKHKFISKTVKYVRRIKHKK